MNKAVATIEISHMPDLLHLAEQVRATKKPRILKVHGETLALVMPVAAAPKRLKKRVKTQADYEAFKAAAGSWKDVVDTEQLKRDIYASRKISTRSLLSYDLPH